MLLCLVVYEINRIYQSWGKKEQVFKETTAKDALVDGGAAAEGAPEQGRWTQYIAVLFPALCDLTATCLMNIGLVLIPASVWQMLRGSMVIFSLVLSYVILGKRYKRYHVSAFCTFSPFLICVFFSLYSCWCALFRLLCTGGLVKANSHCVAVEQKATVSTGNVTNRRENPLFCGASHISVSSSTPVWCLSLSPLVWSLWQPCVEILSPSATRRRSLSVAHSLWSAFYWLSELKSFRYCLIFVLAFCLLRDPA